MGKIAQRGLLVERFAMARHGRTTKPSKSASAVAVLTTLLTLCMAALVSAKQFNYKDALSKSILFFEAQRSGRLPDTQRITWRGDSGLRDGALAGVDLTGGYYDAGDNVKFGFPMAFTITMLSWGAIEYGAQLDKAGELETVQDAIKWGTDYFLKANTGPHQLWVQVGNPNTDHNCWERPEDMDTPRNLWQVNATSPGSEVVAETAAALAAAFIVFRTADPAYSELLLDNAIELFEFADGYKGTFAGACPFYCSHSGYRDELLWASAWLYKATAMRKYLKYVIDNQYYIGSMSEFSWENKAAGVHVLLSKIYFDGQDALQRYKTLADAFVCYNLPSSPLSVIKLTPGGLVYVRIGSNTQYGLNAAFLVSVYAGYMADGGVNQVVCGATKLSRTDLIKFADSQVNYLLGANPLNMSYMTGFGTKYPLQPHHRGASIPNIHLHPASVGCGAGFNDWFSKNAPNPNILVGAIAGGPNITDGFVDKRSSSSYTEPTTYVNAPMVALLARLLYPASSAASEGINCELEGSYCECCGLQQTPQFWKLMQVKYLSGDMTDDLRIDSQSLVTNSFKTCTALERFICSLGLVPITEDIQNPSADYPLCASESLWTMLGTVSDQE